MRIVKDRKNFKYKNWGKLYSPLTIIRRNQNPMNGLDVRAQKQPSVVYLCLNIIGEEMCGLKAERGDGTVII